MNHRRVWLRCSLAISLLWVFSGGAMAWLATFEVTPDDVVAHVQANPLDQTPPDDRPRVIRDLADRMNSLPQAQRRDPAVLQAVQQQFLAMNDDERRAYLDQVLPAGIEQMVQALNQMDPEQRRELIAKAEEAVGGTPIAQIRQRLGDEAFDLMVQRSLNAYLDNADPQTQFQMQPLIEQLQSELQQGRRRRP